MFPNKSNIIQFDEWSTPTSTTSKRVKHTEIGVFPTGILKLLDWLKEKECKLTVTADPDALCVEVIELAYAYFLTRCLVDPDNRKFVLSATPGVEGVTTE